MSVPGTTSLRSWWVLALAVAVGACTSQVTDSADGPTFTDDDTLEVQPLDQQYVVAPEGSPNLAQAITEAPAGFDGLTNGFTTQEEMELLADDFSEDEEVADGLGPLFNDTGCVRCHNSPLVGAGNPETEIRAGTFNGRVFIEPPGGSLINRRSIDPNFQERVPDDANVVALRAATSLMGAGFVEAIDSNTLAAIANSQPARVRGLLIQVEVLEAPDAARVGRFGWKNQLATLLSFAGDAYVNEMGITSSLFPEENTRNGESVAVFDAVPDPEDLDNVDITGFANFMRSTKAPPRDEVLAATDAAQNGEAIFSEIGCATCHVPDIVTAPAGTVINGGTFVVPEALGDKLIHPFSDYLLHNIDTGDGIVQNGGPASRNTIRTAPLWGLRIRSAFLHDNRAFTVTAAIQAHGNQAAAARRAFNDLGAQDTADLLTFLNSL